MGKNTLLIYKSIADRQQVRENETGRSWSFRQERQTQTENKTVD